MNATSRRIVRWVFDSMKAGFRELSNPIFYQKKIDMKKRENYIAIISILLISLWIYTSVSKLMDITLFKSQLSKQALIGDYAGFFVWFLPAIEILAALLLMFTLTRKVGMLLSFSLMTAFTVYIALAVVGIWKNIPCACGGAINQLGWKEHLWFNLFFSGIAGVGIYLLIFFHGVHNRKLLSFRKTLFRPK